MPFFQILSTKKKVTEELDIFNDANTNAKE